MVLALLVIDQIIKIQVKTSMCLHESIRVTDWFYISFIENNGMAYGMSFIPKPLLTSFRFVACCFLVWYIRKEIKAGARTMWLVLLSLVLAGAAGNLIDCMFYGLMFSGSSSYYTSFFVPFGTGYAPFLEGRVVDMFYFPLIVTTYPDWFPFYGGQPYIFFSPVFNFADACISVSVVAIILFCRKELSLLNKQLNEKAQ
ncbi:MAG: lipoprotein signal peptidase [Prevotella sp.]|jgi:signal peptidase II|nr:lipoprotein signal peptidase [Prevotella sp.]MBQ1650548.1 lipoprotein signal peptidase [Prevotella sp.]